MNIVSSPEMVPITSGQRAVSMATATLCAEPTVVFSTVRLVPAVCIALTNCLSVGEIVLDRGPWLGQHIAIAELRHAELAQVAAHARLGRDVAVFAQHGDQLRLASDGLFANDLRERRAPCRGIGIVVVYSHAMLRLRGVHKVARILHKNAKGVNAFRREFL